MKARGSIDPTGATSPRLVASRRRSVSAQRRNRHRVPALPVHVNDPVGDAPPTLVARQFVPVANAHDQ